MHSTDFVLGNKIDHRGITTRILKKDGEIFTCSTVTTPEKNCLV